MKIAGIKNGLEKKYKLATLESTAILQIFGG